MIDADADHEGGAVSIAEPPEKSLPAANRRWFSIREMMVATAVIAFLLAAYRIEVRGARGLGLVPACVLLIAATWYRDVAAARAAAGRPVDLRARLELAAVGVVAAVSIVGPANIAFIIVAEFIGLPHMLGSLLIAIREGDPGFVVPAMILAVSAALSFTPAILVGVAVRRAMWRLAEVAAIAPDASR